MGGQLIDDKDDWDGEGMVGGAAGGDGEGVMADGVAGGLLDSVRAVMIMGMARLLLQVGSEEATDGLRDNLGSGGGGCR
jgi:hypothetical protein